MTFPAFDDAASARPIELLSRSIRLGATFGVEVRVYWLAAMLMPAVALACIAPLTASTGEWLALTALALVLLLAIGWSHEVCHALGARWLGIRTQPITLSPLSALVHPMPATDVPRVELLASLCGPACHVLWLLVCVPMTRAELAPPAGWNLHPLAFVIDLAVRANALFLVLNLLPCFPLDGGRVLRASLARWMPQGHATRLATWFGMAGGLALSLYGVRIGDLLGGLLVVIGLTCLIACIELRREPRPLHIEVDEERRKEPWQSDPDAWRRGAELFPFDTEEATKPPVLARTRSQTTVLMDSANVAVIDDLDEQLDRVLVRIHEVGIKNITDAEREILERASRKRRGAG